MWIPITNGFREESYSKGRQKMVGHKEMKVVRLGLGVFLGVAVWSQGALVNHWPFEEGSGNTTADVGGGETGTLTNMAPASDWVTSGAPVPSGTTYAMPWTLTATTITCGSQAIRASPGTPTAQ
jgi:hypothetical protein